MAILENIRKRTTVLILIIGMALFAFVISGVFTGNDFAGGKIGSTIAEINGEPISREEFTKKLEQAQRQFGPNFSSTQLVNRVYDQEIRGAILNQQFEKLGIDVESDQIVDFIKNTGYAQDPSFQDENGVFNPEVFKATIADWRETNPLLYDNWLEIEKQIMQSAKEQIYFNLIKAGTGATLIEGEFDYKLANDKVDFQYVRVPFASIPDSTIQVSKDEIATYIKEHKDEFEQEKARDIRFVFFEEKASAEDENAVKDELTQLLDNTVEYIQERNTTDTISGFRNTTDMAAFLDRNSDEKFDTIFKAKKDLPALAAEVFDEWFGLLTTLKGVNMLRVKGLINLQGMEKPLVVHGVQHIWHPPAMLPEWPSDDKRSRIVFIMRDMEKSDLEQMLTFVMERYESARLDQAEGLLRR